MAGEVVGKRLDGRRILVLDGDDQVRDVLVEALQSEGALVTDAARAAEALAGLAPGTFDAVVSDADLPDGGGEAVHAALLERDPALAGRVLFLARDPHGAPAAALGRRALVLRKPLALGELVGALVGLLPS